MNSDNPFTRENNHTITRDKQKDLLSTSYIKFEEELNNFMKNENKVETKTPWYKIEVPNWLVVTTIAAELVLLYWWLV